MYVLFPVLLPFFKCILEVPLCEGVQYHCISASITSTATNWHPSILSSIKKTERSLLLLLHLALQPWVSLGLLDNQSL
jgi:hypothetical protein